MTDPRNRPSRPLNTNALLSLLLAVLVFAPLGIYLGRKAKRQIAVTGESGIELAKVGEIYGWVMSAFMVAVLCFWIALVVSGA